MDSLPDMSNCRGWWALQWRRVWHLVKEVWPGCDNILDAYLIDVNGRILNRESMGESLFWAIRGGGGASFGIIVSWKIKLVRVPPTVTVFTIHKTLEQGATKLVHRWQYVADQLHEDIFIRVIIQDVGGQSSGDCTEMTWIESVLYFAGFPRGNSLDVLLNRTHPDRSYFKAKSDYVKEPIPEVGLEESELPFPHRKGNLYNIQYLVKWEVNEAKISNKHVHWIRMLYQYMRPFVSKSPRAAYLNYRDLDLGINNQDNAKLLTSLGLGYKVLQG
ncbi:Berberine bridge enzyme-like 23 [Vitis vinifera]|uniref:Berberine bridge enzyme-like 23 n=1 Tax=Vitis vinifera TaxID=29760 RepID=A0A438H796_VITVI|nr:Berberine bridge enzyme-like 23 [Vitis vinifera]